MTTPFSPVADLHRLFETMYTCGPSVGWTAELEDENDPDGLVVIKDAEGHPKMWMPREVYEAFRNA